MKNNFRPRPAAKPGYFSPTLVFSFLFLAVPFFASAQNCTINAGVDQTICANGTMTLTGATSGQFQGAGTVTWSQLSGSAVTITSPNALTTTVTGFSAGVYVFKISTTCLDGSAINDDVTVTVSPIVVANAGPDQTYCPGGATLAGNAPAPGTGLWTVVGTNSANLGITTSASATSAVTLPTGNAGSTTLRWTITQGACTSFDDVIITNKGGVSPVNAGPDQTLGNCYSSTTTATLAGTFAGGGVGGQAGLWTLISGPNTPTITTPSSRTSTVSGLVQGIYILRWTATGTCVSGFDDVQLTVPAPSSSFSTANGGGNLTYCDGRTAVALTGNTPTYAGETVSWTQTAGPAGATITSPSSAATTITGLNGSSSYTFQYKITNAGTGCSSTANVTVAYNSAPAVTVNGGADFITLACSATSASVPYNVSGGSTTQYRVISAPAAYSLPGSFSNASTSNTGNQTQSVTGLNYPGTYVVRFARSGGTGCTTAFDDVSIIVSQTPTPSEAGTYQVLACNVVATSLAGNIPAIGTGSWSQVSGPNLAAVAVPGLNTSGISGLVNGKYVFKWIISGGTGCTASEDTVSVTVASNTPTVANAGADRTVCHSSPLTLSANQPTLNEWGRWTVSPSAGVSIANSASAVTVVTGLSSNTVYTFTWTISNACGNTSDDVVVTTSGTAGPVQATAGADQCLASGTTSLTLSGNAPLPAGATGLWSQSSGPNTASIGSPGSAGPSVTGLVNGTYEFVRTLSLAGCGNTTDTMKVTISSAATVANAGIDQNVCATGVTLAANTPTVGTGAWSQVAGPGGAVIASPSANNTGVGSLVPGSYTFRWAILNGGCAGNFDDMIVNVSAAPSAANAGADQTCLTATSATLAATTAASGYALWSQVSGPAAATITTPSAYNSTVSGLVNGTYTFRWTITGGPACTPSTDDVIVSINQGAGSNTSATVCNVSTVSLSGTSGTTGTWSQVVGPAATLTAYPGNAASAENLTAGSAYTFRYTLAGVGGCAGSQSDRQITVLAPPSAAAAGVDQSLCNITSFSLSATPPDAGSTGTWTKVSGGSGSFSPNAGTANAVFTGAATGLYTFQWTVSTGTGCSNADQMTVNNAPATPAANAGADQSFCGGTTTNLAATAPSPGTGNWTQVSGPTPATVLYPALATTSVSGLSNGVYTFRWTVSSGACTATTDDMKIGVCAVLPLRLLSFEAEKRNGYANLQWKTENEAGVGHFVVERSSDGGVYSPLAEVAGKNKALNDYAYGDNLNAYTENAVYYRLKTVNTDGSSSYSKVVRMNVQKGPGLSVTVAPNPVRTKAVLQIESGKEGKALIRVLDHTGRAVVVQNEVLTEGTNRFVLEKSLWLSAGLYVVTVKSGEETRSQKLVIQR